MPDLLQPHVLALLAQATDAAQAVPAAPPPWWYILLEHPLALGLLFIFLTAIISTLIVARKKDKCLKLLNDYHVTYLTKTGQTMWGDLVVYSKGIELRFDAPHTTQRGLTKSSALVYESQIADCLALCRLDAGLTEAERRARVRQIRRSFNPGLIRRTGRWFRNMVNTLRDAFNKALGALIGQIAKARPGGAVMTTHRGSVEQIGQTLLGSVAHSYEPLLEPHIGKPVVLTLAGPDAPDAKHTELPGYLVDYTDKYLAVFNVEHEPLETIELDVTEPIEKPQFSIGLSDRQMTITCNGPDVLVVRTVQSGQRQHNLDVALTCGCSVDLPRQPQQPVHLSIFVTRRVDIVCPRALATVEFGGESVQAKRGKRVGLAPQPQSDTTT